MTKLFPRVESVAYIQWKADSYTVSGDSNLFVRAAPYRLC